jgi:putative FmdB family regulatory protein
VPVYQYACTECGHQLEARQSFTDQPLTVCPACEGRLRKVLSAVGVVFKGSGFYRTDSRKSDGAKESGASSDSSKTGTSSGVSSNGSSSGSESNGSGSKASSGSSGTSSSSSTTSAAAS